MVHNVTGAPGVHGENFDEGPGVYGIGRPAVLGIAGRGYAGEFYGDVRVHGILYKDGGGFRIDHPQTPEDKYLTHSFVESDDMKNVYDGNVTTNGKGFATVKLPAYFQALNKNFRYQLTILGHASWDTQARVWNQIKNNRFTIRTNHGGVQISWQVTGIRRDAWANAHRIQTVVPKTGSADNKYVHPELYGKPLTKSVAVLPGMEKSPDAKK